MSIFYESTRRARKARYCDYCPHMIEPGNIYERKFIRHDKGEASLRNMLWCEHIDPPCPDPYMEMVEPGLAEIEIKVELGVPIEMVLENRLMQKVLINGEVVTENEVVTVFREGQAVPMFADIFVGPDTGGDEDIAF